MMHTLLNRLLALHFREAPADRRLDRLEQDVRRRIHAAGAEAALPWGEKIFLSFGEPQFRMASVAAAIMLGVILSPAFPPYAAVRHPSAGPPDMEMFTPHAQYLVINMIEQAK